MQPRSFARIEHGFADHLEDIAFQDVGGDLRISAALDLASIMVVLSGAEAVFDENDHRVRESG
jgi:hypothetical protein